MILKKILRKAKTVIKSIFGRGQRKKTENNIETVKKSAFFSEEYYLNTYPDIRAEGIDAATHYYLYGAEEMRNPSARFNTRAYCTLMKGVKGNPIIHCLNYIKKHSDFLPPRVSSSYIDEMTSELFGKECDPLKSKVASGQVGKRINVFLKNETDNANLSALALAAACGKRQNADIRVIGDRRIQQTYGECLEMLGKDVCEGLKVTFYMTSSNMYIDIGNDDDFVCCDWKSAVCLLGTANVTGRIYCLVTNDEFCFCKNGDYALKYRETLSNEQVVPVICSKTLYDYMCKNGYEGVAGRGICFEAAHSAAVSQISGTAFDKKDKYRLVFFGKSGNSSSVFYYGINVINEALKHGVIDPEKWSFDVVCDSSAPNIGFDVETDMKVYYTLSDQEYGELITSADVCFAMSYGPAVPDAVADAVFAGAVALTDRYDGKQALGEYSSNIITADFDMQSMQTALENACRLAENAEQRKNNYEKAHSFTDIRVQMDKVAELIAK